MLRSAHALDQVPARSFDVVCAGHPRWTFATRGVKRTPVVHGAPRVAVGLARQGFRVGLCTVFDDDEAGREAALRCESSGVDVGAVQLSPPGSGVIVVDAGGGARQAPPRSGVEQPLELPPAWSFAVLLLSGLSPAVAHAAAVCKAARAARRAGAIVVLDFDASLRAWAGRDGRTVRMALREVHVARCSVADLAVLGMDPADARAALRPEATLVVSDGLGAVTASGPFGEVCFAPPAGSPPPEAGSGDRLAGELCADLIRRGEPGESAAARWRRTLQRAWGGDR